VPAPLLYVAYPMRLDLTAANAIQTYSTMRELQHVMPGTLLVVPRWLREPSAFEQLGALHLPRPAVNKLSRFVPWAGWSYIERTAYSAMLLLLLVGRRLVGRSFRVLYVRDAVCAAWLAVSRPLHGARLVYEVHDLESAHPSKASRWPRVVWSRVLHWIDRAALRGSCRVVSLTEAFREWAVQSGIRPADEIAVVPDAYDPDLYYPMDATAARRDLGLPENVFIVGYSGLTFAYRRLDLLVEAFRCVAAEDPSALLVLVGGRLDEVEGVRRQAREFGVEQRVILTGQVPQAEAAQYVAASDVLVIPDTVTGLTASPLKLFEYMAAGRPVVCKDMPALREIADEHSAIFFRPGDSEDLGRALVSLLRGPEARQVIGRAAAEQAKQYTYRARALKIKQVVQDCL
jgi:glycosyltransferase involved in cell wall biosynthesis